MGPVPPVVRIRSHFLLSDRVIKVFLITSIWSGMISSSKLNGLISALVSQFLRLGKPSSLYSPDDARSLIEIKPILMNFSSTSMSL